ncbi:uncharacterized protein LOC110235668 [Exaiptasia diaphana]|uniref:Uncharacterized protein n=1 Tax=Exaiptasia diaphana TaxID=2652724 RepID=A0A913X047_EXADI|nr:uncharacterized protein LOC110235668 [Exaiptasia diaphana]
MEITPTKSMSSYIERLRARLNYAYNLARKGADKSSSQNKKRYDVRARDIALKPGDRVLVRNLSVRGKHKLSDRWEETVHLVVKRNGDLPVYVIQPELGGKLRTIHRNLLLTVDRAFQPVVVPPAPRGRAQVPPEARPRRRRLLPQVPQRPKSCNADTSDTIVDEDEDDPILITVSSEPQAVNQQDAEVEECPQHNAELNQEISEEHAAGPPAPVVSDPQDLATEPEQRTRSGRVLRKPQRLMDDPVWARKAEAVVSIINSQNQMASKNWNFH